uniref:Uncharacterized protein n=1 Tax=Anguilla anguilla TaxID=7936 RepID=A0A0E9TWH8_ANGAN
MRPGGQLWLLVQPVGINPPFCTSCGDQPTLVSHQRESTHPSVQPMGINPTLLCNQWE